MVGWPSFDPPGLAEAIRQDEEEEAEERRRRIVARDHAHAHAHAHASPLPHDNALWTVNQRDKQVTDDDDTDGIGHEMGGSPAVAGPASIALSVLSGDRSARYASVATNEQALFQSPSPPQLSRSPPPPAHRKLSSS